MPAVNVESREPSLLRRNTPGPDPLRTNPLKRIFPSGCIAMEKTESISGLLLAVNIGSIRPSRSNRTTQLRPPSNTLPSSCKASA